MVFTARHTRPSDLYISQTLSAAPASLIHKHRLLVVSKGGRGGLPWRRASATTDLPSVLGWGEKGRRKTSCSDMSSWRWPLYLQHVPSVITKDVGTAFFFPLVMEWLTSGRCCFLWNLQVGVLIAPKVFVSGRPPTSLIWYWQQDYYMAPAQHGWLALL